MKNETENVLVELEDGNEQWYINGKQIDPIPDHIILWEKKLKDEK